MENGWMTSAPELAKGESWGAWSGTSTTLVRSDGCFYHKMRLGRVSRTQVAAQVTAYIAGGDYVPTSASATFTVGGVSTTLTMTASSYSYTGYSRWCVLEAAADETVSAQLKVHSKTLTVTRVVPAAAGGLSLSVITGGAVKTAEKIHVRLDGSWKECDAVFVRTGGQWKECTS